MRIASRGKLPQTEGKLKREDRDPKNEPEHSKTEGADEIKEPYQDVEIEIELGCGEPLPDLNKIYQDSPEGQRLAIDVDRGIEEDRRFKLELDETDKDTELLLVHQLHGTEEKNEPICELVAIETVQPAFEGAEMGIELELGPMETKKEVEKGLQVEQAEETKFVFRKRPASVDTSHSPKKQKTECTQFH